MLAFIKKRLVQLIIKKGATLEHRYRQYELEKIKALPNVEIDDSLSLGKNSTFDIQGTCRKLKIYPNVSTRQFCNFLLYHDASLIIHENVFFNNYCSVNCLGSIEIGENSMFGEGVKMYDHNHKNYYDSNNTLQILKGELTVSPIAIGKNCWISSNVTILKGVEIGDNVIIGANCLVYKSVPSNTVVKGKFEYFIH